MTDTRTLVLTPPSPTVTITEAQLREAMQSMGGLYSGSAELFRRLRRITGEGE